MVNQIGSDSWREELDSFSRQHEGWLVSVTTQDPDGHMLVEARNLPLQGVSQTSPDSNAVSVEVGDAAHHLTHEVRDVTAMRIDVGEDRAERALILESRDRTRTIVAFRSPMQSAAVDGVPPGRRG